MSPKQAEEFAKTWRVVDQYTHSEVWTWTDEFGNETQITGTNGLSVTLFENVETGKRYVAVRGTDDMNDVWTDITDIAILGTPERQAQYATLRAKLNEWLADPQKLQGRTFTVTGHSLGGFLAGALTVDFPTQIEHAYLHDAPGVGGLSAGLRLMLGIEETPSLNLSKISNLLADAGISPIAGLGISWGTPISIAVENQFASDVANPPAAYNHSQQVLTDALALYALYSELSPALTIEQIGKIVKSASNTNNRSLETTLDALRTLLIDGDIASDATKQTKTGDRDDYYKKLYDLQENPNYIGLAGSAGITVLADQGSAALAAQGKNDFGRFLALDYLLPFALDGASSVLIPAHQTRYDAWQADLNLTDDDKAAGDATYSDQWYADRAKMLVWLLKANEQDQPYIDSGLDLDGAWLFQDYSTEKSVVVQPAGGIGNAEHHVLFGTEGDSNLYGEAKSDYLYGMGGNDTINGQGGADYLEGGKGNDTLSGGEDGDILVGGEGTDELYGDAGNDRLVGGKDDDQLYGGAGQDILAGGKGNDQLTGDEGEDIYFFENGSGNDTVTDSGRNYLMWNSGLVAGVFRQEGDSLVYRWAGEEDVRLDFTNGDAKMTFPDGSSVVLANHSSAEAFESNPYGIKLEMKPEAAPSGGGSIRGDIELTRYSITYDPSTWTGPKSGYSFAWYWSAPVWVQQRDLAGTGSVAYDQYHLVGTILPTHTRSYAIGGGTISYYLFDDLGNTIGTPVDPAWVAAGSQYGDELFGSSGNDNILAMSGDDYVWAGGGDDVIVGGTDWSAPGYFDYLVGEGGNDFIYGDDQIDLASQSSLANLGGTINDDRYGDILISGDGDDQVVGTNRNDIIFGGAGKDTLMGAAGDDLICGDQDAKAGDLAYYVDQTSGSGTTLVAEAYGTEGTPAGPSYDRTIGTGSRAFSAIGPWADRTVSAMAGGGADILYGGAGADRIYGMTGSDTLYGEDGKDVLVGGDGNDFMYGGTDDDLMTGDMTGEGAADAGVTRVSGNDYLDGGDGADQLYGESGDDILIGGSGNDKLFGDSTEDGNDFLDGGAGNDELYGGGGVDVLVGGAGTDVLAGGAGKDTYIFRKGDGVDTILDDSVGADASVLIIESDLDPANMKLRKGSLLLDFGNGDAIHIENFDAASPYDNPALERIVFGDGGSQTWNELLARGFDLVGTDGNDVIDGTGAVDRISGLGGDDLLRGLGGADILDGGAGTDYMEGGAGNDRYELMTGEGQVSTAGEAECIADIGGTDTVVIGGSVSSVARNLGGDDLLIGYGNNDWVVVVGGTNRVIERFEIGGQSLTYAELIGQYSQEAIIGTAQDGRGLAVGGTGNDALALTGGNTDFSGGRGDDSFISSGGGNSYYYSMGDGNESITDTSLAEGFTTANKLVLGSGITVESLVIYRNGNDVTIRFPAVGGEIRLVGQYASGGIDVLQFADGTTWDRATIDLHVIRELTDSADTYTGTSNAETLYGLGGNDTVRGMDGNDFIDGGAGADTLYGGNGDDILAGGSENDYLYGDAGTDTLRGGDGNDSIYGGTGNDVLDGGFGNDTLSGNAGADEYLFHRGWGSDTISNSDGDAAGTNLDVIRFADDITPNDVIASRYGDNLILSLVGTSDKVTVQSYFFTRSYAVDLIRFSDGTEWNSETIKALVLTGSVGNDTLVGYDESGDTLTGNLGNDQLYGLAGNDVLLGGDGSDSLNGNDGDDVMIGGRGNDTLYGGSGSDTYRYSRGDGGDTIYCDDSNPASFDVIEFGDGITPADISVGVSSTNLYTDVILILANSSNYDYVRLAGFRKAGGEASAVDEIRFQDGTVWTYSDVVSRLPHPTEGDDNFGNSLYGTDGDDHIDGLGGNDSINTGPGNDTLIGGTGDDYLSGGDGDDALSGGAGKDQLDGGKGNDSLAGGTGIDVLAGKEGNDTYVFGRGDGQDTIDEYIYYSNLGQVDGGNDTLRFADGVAPGDVGLYRMGNDLIAVIDGSSTQATLSKFYKSTYSRVEYMTFGDGTIWDSAAIDARTVTGTANAMTGTSSDDLFVVDNTADTISEAVNQGTDTVQSSVNWTLGANIENLTLTGILNSSGIGNNLSNLIVGNDSNNVLYDADPTQQYSDAADTLVGGKGDDTYYVDDSDVVVEQENGGVDTVYARESFTLPDNVENLIGSDWANYYKYTLTGNALDNLIDGSASQYFKVIDGGAGADTMICRGLFDIKTTYYVDNVNDVVIDRAELTATRYGSEADVIISSVDYTLPTAVEDLTLAAGTIAMIGTGNDRDNWLLGNENNNILYGQGGNDTFFGGLGADTYVGGAGDDTYSIDAGWYLPQYDSYGTTITWYAAGSYPGITSPQDSIVEEADGGYDKVYSSFDYTLPDNVETLILGGFSNSWIEYAFVGNGNSLNNALYGNANANVLDGKGGADGMYGGAGDDTYYVDNIGDVVGEQAGGGTDTVISQVSYGLSDNVENLILTGTGNDTGTGNGLNNRLDGSQSAGANQLTGGLGDDTYVLGIEDTIIEFSGEGTDTVVTDEAYSLVGAAIENITLSGTAAIDATGNELDNVIDGNSGNNRLDGGAGNDTYRFGRGGGQDVVADGDTTVGNTDKVVFKTGVAVADIRFSLAGDDLVAAIAGTSDQIVVEGQFGATGSGIEEFWFEDTATVLTAADVSRMVNNRAPVVATPLADQSVGESSAFSYAIPVGAFSDPDVGDTLSFSATLADGSALPSWLAFNPGTQAFSGIPPLGSAGVIGIEVTVTDAGGLAVSDVFDLTITVQNLTLNGTSAANTLTGGGGNDTLNGLGGNDTLNGNAGNDTLDGGTGSDKMYGGLGDDTYVVNVSTDTIYENANEGIDTVKSSVTLTLGNNVENLTLTGTSAISGTGNALDNVLTGNSAANTLTGGAGNDTLDGGSGSDTMVGGTGNDIYVVNVSTDKTTENANEGIDTVRSSVTLTLGNNVENLTLTGTSAINGTGNTLANVLTGNTANNTLTGNAGNDTLDGGTGTDSLVGGTGNDTYLLGRGYGADTITENDSTAGNTDIASFLSGIGTDQIWFRHVGTALEVSIIGTSDKLTINNWYGGSRYHVEQFKTADGKTLVDTKVETLVQAMAAFSPPAAGQTTLPSNYQTALQPVIAANWQ